MINGEEISATKTYKVLTDIESLQARTTLHKFITSGNMTTYQEMSWQVHPFEDEVKVGAAGLGK